MNPIEEAIEIATLIGVSIPKKPPLSSPYDPYLGYQKEWVVQMRGLDHLKKYELDFKKDLACNLEHLFESEFNWAGLVFKNKHSYRIILSHTNHYVMSVNLDPNLSFPYVVTSTTENYFLQKPPLWFGGDPYMLLVDPPIDFLTSAFNFLNKAWAFSLEKYEDFQKGLPSDIQQAYWFWSKENTQRSFLEHERDFKGLNFLVFKLIDPPPHTLQSNTLDFTDYFTLHQKIEIIPYV